MKKNNGTIYQHEEYRIRELQDWHYDLENLKGEMYCPKVNNSICPVQLKREEMIFEREVSSRGVYGYVLEKWNSQVDTGWEELDSCWGFIGQYNENEEKYNHCIINEFKGIIAND